MIFRLRDYVLYPHRIWREHRWLGETERWTTDVREAWAGDRLLAILDHASKNVPWYRDTLGPHRERFPEMVRARDLSDLPVLEKDDVRRHYDALRSDDCEGRRTSTTETSGSTGTPTRFLLDADSNVHQFAAIWRVLNWAGYRFGQRYADMTGFLPRGDGLWQYDWRTNCLHLSSFNFKKENMPAYVARLRQFRPVFIKAYPSALCLFCRWLQELGIDDFRPPRVLCCAESLLEHQRALIADVLRCPIYDFYGQNERGALISTCEHGTYHVHEEYAFTELAPTDTPGVYGILATNYHNWAMPLIRYRTDDLAEAGTGEPCPCGRTYATVARIIGRIEDVVVTPDGRHVGRLDAAFKWSPGIRMSQVVQERTDEIRVLLVPAQDYAESDRDRVERELRARLGTEIGIRYELVDDIRPGPNGKVKFMVSRIGQTTTVPQTTSGPD